jgi:hypothetical protein
MNKETCMKRVLLMACVGVLGCVSQQDDEVVSTEAAFESNGEICQGGPKLEPFKGQAPKFDTDKHIVLLMRDGKEPKKWSYVFGVDVGSKRIAFAYYLPDDSRVKAMTWQESYGLGGASQGYVPGGTGGGPRPNDPPPGVYDGIVAQGIDIYESQFIEPPACEPGYYQPLVP